MFVPKRRSQRGDITTLSLLLETPLFIGPNSLSLDNYISRDQYVTSDEGFLVPPYIHFRLYYIFFTLIIGFLFPLSLVPSFFYTNTIFSTLLIGFFVPSSRRPSSLVPRPIIINNSDLSHPPLLPRKRPKLLPACNQNGNMQPRHGNGV